MSGMAGSQTRREDLGSGDGNDPVAPDGGVEGQDPASEHLDAYDTDASGPAVRSSEAAPIALFGTDGGRPIWVQTLAGRIFAMPRGVTARVDTGGDDQIRGRGPDRCRVPRV